MKAALALGLGLILNQVAVAADAELPLEDDWYRIEIVVFERGQQSDSQEALNTSAPRYYPANLTAPIFVDMAFPGGGFAPLTVAVEPFPEPSGVLDVSEEESGSGPESLDGDESAAAALDPETGDPSLGADTGVDPAVPLIPFSHEQQLQNAFDAALATYVESLRAEAFQWQVGSLTLADEAAAIGRRGIGTVLLHGAWMQPVPDRAAPQPVLLLAGPLIDDRHRLEGSIAITRGRFLHAHAELWYQIPTETSREPTFLNLADREGPVMAGIPFDLDERVDVEAPYQVLSERRRMRSEELHYLDHPSIGVLISVVPHQPPTELVELFEQLEEGVE